MDQNIHYSQKNHCNDNCNDFSDYNDIIAPLEKVIMLHYHNDLNNYHHHDDLCNHQYNNNLYMWDMYGLNAELGFLDTWWSQDNKLNSKRCSTLFLFSSSDSADLIGALVHSFAILRRNLV